MPDLPEHLYQDIDELHIVWEEGGKQRMAGFYGDISTAWVRAGQQTFPLPTWLVHGFNVTNSTITQHRKSKAAHWDKIIKDIDRRKKDGEFSFGEPSPATQKQNGGGKENIMRVEISKMPELVIRNAEESTVTKGKKRISLPKFKPTDWAKITIRFLDERNVLINADKKEQVVADYEALGFSDEKRGKPNMAWTFFRGLAQKNGETVQLPTPIPDNIKQQKRQLSDRLKTIFKNDTDPFHDSTETHTYKIKINLIPPSENEKNDDLGMEEYWKEATTN